VVPRLGHEAGITHYPLSFKSIYWGLGMWLVGAYLDMASLSAALVDKLVMASLLACGAHRYGF
jgi:hypothetical protein